MSETQSPPYCYDCKNSDDFTEIVKDYVDIGLGYGNGIPCEIDYRCNKCKRVTDFWAYGQFQQ